LRHAMKSEGCQDPCSPDSDVYTYPDIAKSNFWKYLPKYCPIGKAVWDQRGDIRDVISIGKLVRKNDGPEEVEQILSTMIKYGEMKEY
jgi:hypothetical protein